MKKLLAMTLLISTTFVLAETNTSTPPVPTMEVLNKDTPEVLSNKKFEETKEITDAKLKADSGSLSKYSLKFSLSYYGPTLNDLSSKDQPNPDGTVGTYETSLGGSFGARYRIDSKSSISAGTGVKAIYPLHGFERFELNNPYISYDMLTKFSGIQMRNSPGISYITVRNYKLIGEFGSLNYDFSMVYDLLPSNFSVSFDSSIGYYLYKRPYRTSDRKAARYNLAFFPGAKYKFTDKFNINTSLSLNYYNARSRSSHLDLQSRTISQRIGLGYAFTRDVYISPYLNFFPNNIAAKATTINLSASFSLL